MHITLFILLSIFLPVSVHAEAIFDGTMNPETKGQKLSGDFIVKQSDGSLVGDNLFHSFSHFSINSDESATFYSSNQIKNIISRVTGTDLSRINGGLRSFINGSKATPSPANFYLLNPNGVIFGSNAQLDIGGSFYVLTCDYISMEDGQTFDLHSEFPVLSMTSPHSFGFLDKSAGSIEINGGENNLELKVEKNQRISLIANGVNIQKSFIEALSGQIYIASISGACEVVHSPNGYENMDTIGRGPISIKNNSELYVSGYDYGDASGDIFIMGGHVLFSDSVIEARTEGKQNGGITIIDGTSITLDNQAFILSDNISHPSDPSSSAIYYGGNVLIRSTGGVVFSDSSKIETGASASNNFRDPYCYAGSVTIDANSISFVEFSKINSHSDNAGKAGDFHLIAQKDILFSDSNLYSEIIAYNHDTTNNIPKTKISINAQNISFLNKAGIASQTTNYGDGGDIYLNAQKNIYMDSG